MKHLLSLSRRIRQITYWNSSFIVSTTRSQYDIHFCFVSLHTEVVVKYRGKIRSMETEIKQILKQEEEERQLRLTEMEINKATNLIEHHDEIISRPARTWIKTNSKKRSAPDISDEKTLDLVQSGVVSKKAKREEIKKSLAKKMKSVGWQLLIPSSICLYLVPPRLYKGQ